MSIRLGTTNPSAFRLGNTAVSKLMLGTTEVWSSVFDPLSLSPALWLDASDANTLFDAVSGGSLVAANGTIARWQDKSGNARHVTQSTLGFRPTRRTSIQNGRDVVRFDVSDDHLISSNVSSPSAFTFFAVVKANTWNTTGTNYQSIASHGYQNPWTNTGISFLAITGGAQDGWLKNDGLIFGDGFTQTQYPRAIGPIASGSDFRVISTTLGSGEARGWINGTRFTTRVENTGGAIESFSRPIRINGTPGLTEPFGGDYCEILYYPTQLSTSNRQAVQNYLGAKWGITVA